MNDLIRYYPSDLRDKVERSIVVTLGGATAALNVVNWLKDDEIRSYQIRLYRWVDLFDRFDQICQFDYFDLAPKMVMVFMLKDLDIDGVEIWKSNHFVQLGSPYHWGFSTSYIHVLFDKELKDKAMMMKLEL